MTKRLDITARQIAAICEGAKKSGFIPEIKIGNVFIRLVPASQSTTELTAPMDISYSIPQDNQLADLGPTPRHQKRSQQSNDIPDPLHQFYKRIGFNPKTMNHAKLVELQNKADEEWKASLPSRPIGKREIDALEDLSNHGVGVFVDWREVKGCGPETEDRLVARGFIKTRNSRKFPDRIASYAITKAGMDAWKKIEQERGIY
ncbi:hypothetical protein [Brucella pseudogrignonensis]|uniref:hypothetical protein n=1 Tax=Brucella pseudogrignonensis TaxID=419475 RepID=UPI000CFB4178|nr:hypothetical protein [Brucella pseudogrignonensis]MQP40932.1 hypothetical protein [Ochrobactrum sp. MYb237]PQZ40886.1 hypothetical protein CQ059_16675 [Brucella pseudogrignonensis]PRA40395.1 hypothetical protein CQ063_12480 [Brucella pseudogrignonensis]PRA68988.1 hypothetical protein CQ055_12365 [Brucella pseudogrignonensis]